MKTFFLSIACFLTICATAQKQNILVPLVGVNSIQIGKPYTQAIQSLGKEYTTKEIAIDYGKIIYVEYSSLGISFEYVDSIKTITNIWFTKPCAYKTEKGIEIETSTVKDVIAAYGSPQLNTSSSIETGIIYEGIIFYFASIPNVQYWKNPERFENSIISKIEVVNNSDRFEE